MLFNIAKCWKWYVSPGLGTGFRIFLKIPQKYIFSFSETVILMDGIRSAIKSLCPKEMTSQTAPIGGPPARINPQGTQQRERPLPAFCPLISSWKENLSLSSHPRVSARHQKPLELPLASGGTGGSKKKKKKKSGYFFTAKEKSPNSDQRASWTACSNSDKHQQIKFHNIEPEALPNMSCGYCESASPASICSDTFCMDFENPKSRMQHFPQKLQWKWEWGHAKFDFFFRLCAKGHCNTSSRRNTLCTQIQKTTNTLIYSCNVF